MPSKNSKIPTWEESRPYIPTWEESEPLVPETPAEKPQTKKIETKVPVGEVTKEEVQSIVNRHKLGPKQAQQLYDNLAFFGTKLKGEEQDILDQLPGFISDSVGLGLAQKYTIETADTPELKNALDDLRQLAEKRKSGLRTAAEIGTSFLVPGLGAAKLGKAALKTASVLVPATEMGAHAPRGEEAEAVLLGGTVGGTLGIVVPELLRVTKGLFNKAAEKEVEKSLKNLPKEFSIDEAIEATLEKKAPVLNVERKALRGEKISPEEARAYLTKAELEALPPEKRTAAWINDLTEQKLISRLEEFEDFAGKDIESMERQGQEFMQRQYERFLQTRAASEVIVEEKLQGKVLKVEKWKRLLYKFSDNKPLYKIFDKKLGTNLEKTIDTASKKHAGYTVIMSEKLKKINELAKTLRDYDVPQEKLYDALDTGDFRDVPSEAVRVWKEFFETERKNANRMGMNIPQVVNYVPNRRLPLIEYTAVLKEKADKFKQKYGTSISELTQDSFEKTLKKDTDFHDLINEVQFVSGLKTEIKDVGVFQQWLNRTLYNAGTTRHALALDAFAAEARTGKIPEFVRDKNLSNLASSWIESVYRSLALRDSVAELKRYSKVAEDLGDDFAAGHVRNLIEDIIGSREDTVSRAVADIGTKIAIVARNKANTTDNRFNKKIYEGIAASPYIANAIMRQVYANYLGLNPKSALQNLASPVTFVVPDLGIGYGTVKYIHSLVDVKKVLVNGIDITLSEEVATRLGRRAGDTIRTRNINLVLQNEGLLGQQWKGEMVEAARGVFSTGPFKAAARKTEETYTNIMMGMFEFSEIFVRGNSYFMGKRIGKDLINDPAFARRFLANLDSPGYRRSIIRRLEENDLKGVQNELVQYLNSNNFFNYDRINMSAYGRYFGPLISTFSKWPTSIAGRILATQELRGAGRGAIRNAQTLLAPYAAFKLIDKWTDPGEDNELYNRIVGRKGLAGWTAIDSVLPYIEQKEGILSSPAMQTSKSLSSALFGVKEEGGLKKFNKAMQDALDTYGPGSGMLRFLGEDLPIYRGKPKPTGPKIERRLEQINKQLRQFKRKF